MGSNGFLKEASKSYRFRLVVNQFPHNVVNSVMQTVHDNGMAADNLPIMFKMRI